MAEYDPPIFDVPVFNPAYFINEDEITKSYLRNNFLEYPIGQGLETLPDLRVENDKINLGLSTVSGEDSIAIGHSATASDTEAVAIGHNSTAGGNESIAIGHNSTAGEDGICLGHNSTGGIDSVVLGHNNTCGENSLVLGHSSTADGEDSIALGRSATTSTNISAIAIGKYSSSSSFSSALGWSSSAGGGGSTAVGVSANSSGLRATAIGRSTVASGQSSIALGDGATATADNEIQLGTSASKLNLEGRLNLKNNGQGDTSLITYANAIKMYRNSNGLTIGNYGEFAVNVADTTAEPTTVPTTRAGINCLYISADGSSYFGNSNFNKTTTIKSLNQRTYLGGYSVSGNMSLNASRYITTSSDRRLKENIETYDEPSIEKIMKLKPAYYNWIDDKSKKKELGFIAQDVEDIIPEAVDGKKYEYEWKIDDKGEAILDASGNLQFTEEVRHRGFSDRPVIAVLVKAVQEQQEQIESLKTEIEKLKIST